MPDQIGAEGVASHLVAEDVARHGIGPGLEKLAAPGGGGLNRLVVGGIVIGLVALGAVGVSAAIHVGPFASHSVAGTVHPQSASNQIVATVTGSYSGSFTLQDSKCYSSGYLFKYEEDFLLKATDGTIWLVNIVPDLNGSPGFFFAEHTAAGAPDPTHTYWGYGSGGGQTVTINPGKGGSVNHDIYPIGVSTGPPAGHLKITGTCPAGSPTS
jgi:hypothetical protein